MKTKPTFYSLFVGLLTLGGWLLLATVCLGQYSAFTDYYPIPLQTYAVLDISAASTKGLPVSLLALDDNGNAAFAYHTTPSNPVTDTCNVFEWSNGVTKAGAILQIQTATTAHMQSPGEPPGSPPSPSINVVHSFGPQFVSPAGTLYGGSGWILPGILGGGGGGTPFQCSSTPPPGAFPPPFQPCNPGYALLEQVYDFGLVEDPDFCYSGQLNCVTSNGSSAGVYPVQKCTFTIPENSDWYWGGCLGNVGFAGSTVFDPNTYYYYIYGLFGLTLPCFIKPNPGVVVANFIPSLMNNLGWAVGGTGPPAPFYPGSAGPSAPYSLWNATNQSFVPLPNAAVGLNDSNDVLVFGNWVYEQNEWQMEGACLYEQVDSANPNPEYVNPTPEYFFDSGSTPGLLPDEDQTEMRNVYPFLLSSRLTGTFATPQPVLSILLTAEIRRSAKRNTWQPSTFLLRKFSDGTTDLHEVTTPGIAQYVSINSSGVVAAFSGTPAGIQDALLLVPVDITLNVKGSPPPKNGTQGVIAQNGGTITFNLNGSSSASVPIAPGQPVWYSRQLKQCSATLGDTNTNDYFTPWQPIGPTGNTFDYTPAISGIFQVEAVFFGDTQHPFQYSRHFDTPTNYITDSFGDVARIYAKGQPDYFGVVDSVSQITCRNSARALLGSTAYAQNSLLPAYAARSAVVATKNKCNAFVYDQAESAGLPVPVYFSLWHLSYYPPSANNWWNALFAIAHWSRLPTSTCPQPGLVTAGPETPGGHAGIVDYDGSWINAGKYTVNKYPQVTFCTNNPYATAACREFTPQ